ncbi:hypothetical protein CS063_13745 [Sporanaerobium hydrogeniformans]|uniref:Uncharacterized protein n=1 Tax=Sporanaerobium hydrogeniformans TaxID=3072179 RepID=A0AC61DAM1_9FIRM|nr:HK97-gp10 family putative phage morphogenesis protein [Sporanaerobium hydrogeniformans]PHV69776.1 hypothetical protein CS063_13745 [Sporanaerobium hydrogeniformans]
MSMKMTVSNDEIDLKVIINDSKIAGDNILKACGKILKARVVGNLNAIRTNIEHRHMADDVQSRIVKDKFGYDVLKVGGGSATGTKWHIVNDGNYGNQGTHFMDRAIERSQPEIEELIDEELRKAGF